MLLIPFPPPSPSAPLWPFFPKNNICLLSLRALLQASYPCDTQCLYPLDFCYFPSLTRLNESIENMFTQKLGQWHYFQINIRRLGLSPQVMWTYFQVSVPRMVLKIAYFRPSTAICLLAALRHNSPGRQRFPLLTATTPGDYPTPLILPPGLHSSV